MLSNTHNCFTYSTHKVYHQSVKLIVILCRIVLFLPDFLVAASSCQCDSSNFERSSLSVMIYNLLLCYSTKSKRSSLHGCLFKLNLSMYAVVRICMPIVTIKLNFQLENLRKQKNMVSRAYKQVKSRGYRFLFNCKDLGPAALGLHSWIKTSPLAFNLYLKHPMVHALRVSWWRQHSAATLNTNYFRSHSGGQVLLTLVPMLLLVKWFAGQGSATIAFLYNNINTQTSYDWSELQYHTPNTVFTKSIA